MNAGALKHGWMQGGNAETRERLRAFWQKAAGLEGFMSDAIVGWLRAVAPSRR